MVERGVPGEVARRLENRTDLPDQELVAAEPTHHVLRAHGRAQPAGHLAQDDVAGEVTEPVVDQLEVVEVHKHHRDLALSAPPTGGRRVQALQQQGPAGQLGERVVQGHVPHPELDGTRVGHVLHEQQRPHRVRARRQRNRREHELHAGAVAPLIVLVRGCRSQLLRPGAGQQALSLRLASQQRDLGGCSAQQGRRIVPQQGFECSIDPLEGACSIQDGHREGACREHLEEQGFQLGQPRFGVGVGHVWHPLATLDPAERSSSAGLPRKDPGAMR